jgi:Undecaprenyl-phosphate galactose phosphotransferase WbaP
MLTDAVLESAANSAAAAANGNARAIPLGSSRQASRLARRYRKFSGLRAVALFGSDVAAFFVSALIAAAGMALGALATVPVALERIEVFGVGWHGWETLLVLAVLLSHLAGRGHYTQRVPFWTELGDLVRSTGIALLFDFVLTTKIYAITFSSEAMLRWVLFVPMVLALRTLARAALDRAGLGSLRTIIVGEGGAARAAGAALSSDKSLGYDVVAEVGLDAVPASADGRSWLKLLEAHAADFIVVALGGDETRQAQGLLASLALARVPFAAIPTVGGLPVFGFDAQYFFSHDVMLLVNRNNLLRPLNRLMKLAFDYVGALLLLAAVAPLFLVIAFLIKRDGGPVFYRHQRIGIHGRPFGCLKFRSMTVNADEVLRWLLARDPKAAGEWEATQKLRDDPRVTPVGRFLRATSLDELPQLLNVLRGEMSLVGPRPIVAAESARYGENLPFYTEARPGITGLWQVSGRSDTSYERRVELDVWYVKNWTLWHDIAILIKTIPAVMRRNGAV